MKVNKIICKTNEEWRAERSHSVGASAVGAIIGEDYFKTPMQLAVTMREELARNFICDFILGKPQEIGQLQLEL